MLQALQNASVVTDVHKKQIVNNGGPPDVQAIVKSLGVKSKNKDATIAKLSSGITLISKPSKLHVPAWQMVSALLDGASLRTATWWKDPKISSTRKNSEIACWSDSLGKPGNVDIALSGSWHGKDFGLTGGLGANYNHAKIGVSTDKDKHFAIFGDIDRKSVV